MNTANLQVEGLLLAAAAICAELKRKGVLDAGEIDAALNRAEEGASDRATQLSDANVDAIHFPIRFLRQALRDGDAPLDYRTITADVGRLLDMQSK